MTAPLDIGLEQTDAQLNVGQDDMFDLEHTRRSLKNAQQQQFMTDVDGDIVIDDDDDAASEQSDDDEALNTEDERERKVAKLENDMDTMYDAYQERLRDRDIKYKTKESRRRNAEREEWNGVTAKDSDDEDSDAESEGGYDIMERNKLDDGDSSSGESSDGEDDDEAMPAESAKHLKRRKAAATKSEPQSKKRKITTSLTQPNPAPGSNGAASIWFKQDVFSGIGGLDVSDDDMESEEDEEEESPSEVEEDSMVIDEQVSVFNNLHDRLILIS